MSDYNWPEEVAYVNAVDFSADQRLADYHPRAVTANGKSAYRQKIQLLGNDKLKIFVDSNELGGKSWADMAIEVFDIAEFSPTSTFPDTMECEEISLSDLRHATPAGFSAVKMYVTLVSRDAPDPLDFSQTYNLFLTTLLWKIDPVPENAGDNKGLSAPSFAKTSYTWRG